jgi:uncharacterized membrane protein (TIGR02234 family)
MADRPRSRTFGPAVLAGLAGGVLAAVAATHDWATASGTSAGVAVAAAAKGSSSAPLAVALALVALAAWGVVLVLRGRVRRVVAVVGALAAAGVVASTVAASSRVRQDAVAAVVAKGGTGHAFGASLSGWYYACVIGGLLCLVALAVAVIASPRWPAMGARYDAPAARTQAPATEQDMWRSLDEGHDPTA